jgi:hypothetical protein
MRQNASLNIPSLKKGGECVAQINTRKNVIFKELVRSPEASGFTHQGQEFYMAIRGKIY